MKNIGFSLLDILYLKGEKRKMTKSELIEEIKTRGLDYEDKGDSIDVKVVYCGRYVTNFSICKLSNALWGHYLTKDHVVVGDGLLKILDGLA